MKTVLIIGSGIAGLSCAVYCVEKGHKAILVSPYSSERSQSVMAAGGINAALDRENDSVEGHISDTLKGGCHIGSAQAVSGMCNAAPEIIKKLEDMGTVFTYKNGKIDLRPFGGQSHNRTIYSGTSTGKHMVSALVLKVRQYQAEGLVQRRYGLWFHSGLIRDGVCYGALFFNECIRALEPIYADATVIATGGQNSLFSKITGSNLCDGFAAGKLFAQGVNLKNLEFIQYHPTALETPQKRMLISEAARGEGGRLYYINEGKRVYFMEDKYGPKGNLMPRDIVSKCIYDAPSQVFLDLTHIDKDVIDNRLWEVKDLCSRYAGIDITKESIPVTPAVHFFMGGISVDKDHRTNVSGLYAVGECASLYHGANRLGGNSLLAAVYGGKVVAEALCKESFGKTEDFTEYIQAQKAGLQEIFNRESPFSAMYIRQDMGKIMDKCLGIIRDGAEIADGLEQIDYMILICDKFHFDNSFSPYHAFSLKYLLILARAVLTCAKERKETRGAHIRKDYPQSDDRFCCSTLISYNEGEYKVSFKREDCQ